MIYDLKTKQNEEKIMQDKSIGNQLFTEKIYLSASRNTGEIKI